MVHERDGERKTFSQVWNSLGFDIKKSGFQFCLHNVTNLSSWTRSLLSFCSHVWTGHKNSTSLIGSLCTLNEMIFAECLLALCPLPTRHSACAPWSLVSERHCMQVPWSARTKQGCLYPSLLLSPSRLTQITATETLNLVNRSSHL